MSQLKQNEQMHGYMCAQGNGECSELGKIEIIRSQEFMPSELRKRKKI